MTATMRDKGADYVKAWPAQIGRQIGLSAVYVIRAINEVTGSNLRDSAAYSGEYLEDVAALTPDAARAVIAIVRRTSADLAQHARTHCQTCGLPLTDGACTECV